MLVEAVESYLALRRSLGYILDTPASYLRSFAQFASERAETHLAAQTAIDWARLSSSAAHRDRRLKIVIRFARHAHTEDSRHEIPPDGVFGHHGKRRPLPFIFTPNEIERLIKQAFRLTPTGSLRPYTYGTLFALLSATGMRISEAVNLRLDDFTPDGLVIRETKFRKSRFLPLHDTVVAGLERYLARRRRLAFNDDHLLVQHNGRPLCGHTVYCRLRKLALAAGIEPRPGCPNPRLSSFRHTFAVRALESCPETRDAIGRHMLALSTYMGHVSVTDTYWYLEATRKLMTDISKARSAFVKGQLQ